MTRSTKTITAIKQWKDNGFSVKAIASQFNITEEMVRKVLNDEPVDFFEGFTKEEHEVRRVGYSMLKKPNKSLIAKRFGGDEAAYAKCVEMVFGVSL